jgi:acetyl esterase/lipase
MRFTLLLVFMLQHVSGAIQDMLKHEHQQHPAMLVQTFTYKPQLQADVYTLPSRSNQPVVVFIHGGALMMGSRSMSTNSGSLLHALVTAGYAVVSIDYRLAPQVKLPAILEDVEDAWRWVREQGPKLFHTNPDEMFVMGQSAGGYLTLMAGFRVKPRPKALVSFWGYGDIAGSWYSQPDRFYLQQPLVSKEEADRMGGVRLYLYCRQQGLWPKVLTGHDPHAEPKAFDPFCPVRNLSKHYPPTLLIHGDKDTDVPYEQSVLMAKELSRKGVAHEFITLTNVGHGIPRRDTATAARTYAQVIQFLNQHHEP